MKVGLQIPYFTYPGSAQTLGDTFAQIARDADSAGFYSLWVMDHFFQVGGVGPKEREMLESYSTLAFAAGITSRIKLGALVTGVTYRYPGILVKTVTTLDVLSGGRAYLGVGAAWNEAEHRGLGVPFPPLAERFEMLEETLQIARRMWRREVGEVSPFRGKHFTLEEPLNVPQVVSKPSPPIKIGGEGEQKTFRLIARYADACNIAVMVRAGGDHMARIPVAKQKFEVLRERCEEIGRPFDEIERTTLSVLTISENGARPEGSYDTRYEEVLMTPS
jgi:F420-dependent oxidoreductase-like protein